MLSSLAFLAQLRNSYEGLGYWLSDAELLAAIQPALEPIVVGAHTHRTFERRVGDRWVLNCGSVGMPFNGDPAAQYMVLRAHAGAWHAEFRRIPYDRELVYAAWEQTDYMSHSTCAQILKYEVETATFHFGAYLEFCEAKKLDRNMLASVEAYRAASRDVQLGRKYHGPP